MGTPAYMAPEQARGDISRIRPHTDVFALGGILDELLSGRPPFCLARPEPPQQLRPEVSRDIESVCRSVVLTADLGKWVKWVSEGRNKRLTAQVVAKLGPPSRIVGRWVATPASRGRYPPPFALLRFHGSAPLRGFWPSRS
jgi:serine/threonine protein kinase